MTKTKVTKRALLSSVLALLLCVSMLIGTTYAWFTDSVVSSGNIIKSGKLDVSMKWADGKASPTATDTVWRDASEGAIFNYDLWEPGYTDVRHIAIKNDGTLALKYKVQIVANGPVTDLADVIDVYYMDPAEQIASREALATKTPMGTLKAALAGMDATASGNLLAGQSHTITIALKMQESAGNEYQNKSIGTDFSIQLIATQYTYEEDSFDDQYDADAVFPSVATVTIPAGTTEASSITAGGITVALPANQGDTANVYKLDVSDVDMTADDTTGEIEVGFDATLYLNNAKVVSTEQGYVYAMSLSIPAGSNLTSVKHNGNALTLADTGADQTYTYDQATGEITIYSKSFSPFSVSYVVPVADIIVDKNGVKTNFNASDYNDSLASAFDAAMDFAFANVGGESTVLVMKDITFSANSYYTYLGSSEKVQYHGEDKYLALPDNDLPNITIDLGGKTLNYPSSAQCNVFLGNANVIVKNGTITSNATFGVLNHLGGGDLTISEITLTCPGFAITCGGDQTVKNDQSGYDVATLSVVPHAVISCPDDWYGDDEAAIAGVRSSNYYDIANDCTITILSRENGVILFDITAKD